MYEPTLSKADKTTIGREGVKHYAVFKCAWGGVGGWGEDGGLIAGNIILYQTRGCLETA